MGLETTSPLVTYSRESPNNSGPRVRPLTRITPHCIVGHMSVESLGDYFSNSGLRASSNYGIDDSGCIGAYVGEECRSWCSSSADNDNKAITIECASDSYAPFAMTDTVWDTLGDLCVDICKRYGKKRLLWIPDRMESLAYQVAEDEMLLTVHRWFADTECPGDWLMGRMGELATLVTSRLSASKYDVVVLTTKSRRKAKRKVEELSLLGIPASIKKRPSA